MLKTIPFHQELLENGTVMEVLLYGLIEVLSYEKGFCYASNAYLAKELGISAGTLANKLSNISKKGWVQVQFNDTSQREAIIPQFVGGFTPELRGGSLYDEGGVHCTMNKYIKKDNIVDNITNKDKSLLVIGETPVDGVVENSKRYGNEQVNEAFDLWEEMMGLEQKTSKKNRWAAYNLVRSKGIEWIQNSLKILIVAKATAYVPKEISGIANFEDLERNWERLWDWGKRHATLKAKATITDKI